MPFEKRCCAIFLHRRNKLQARNTSRIFFQIQQMEETLLYLNISLLLIFLSELIEQYRFFLRDVSA